MDSGFIYALLDGSDRNHLATVKVVSSLRGMLLVLPTPTIVEIAYLLSRNLGHQAMRSFILSLYNSPLILLNIENDDFPRIFEILEQYSNLKLDFVDAASIAIAERFNIKTILTVDRRDFGAIRPKHCDYFEILP